ncbi:hypothetical protein E2C01_048140 [Portunus trituberculatus]|uniref:Uncharacterized protein n=1 Tax=Portunus trituberculatus TaxID=210409 RepID=A0A5B7G2C6_PORTR|nr:hypothetical protein [Portunus trituberculatus]
MGPRSLARVILLDDVPEETRDPPGRQLLILLRGKKGPGDENPGWHPGKTSGQSPGTGNDVYPEKTKKEPTVAVDGDPHSRTWPREREKQQRDTGHVVSKRRPLWKTKTKGGLPAEAGGAGEKTLLEQCNSSQIELNPIPIKQSVGQSSEMTTDSRECSTSPMCQGSGAHRRSLENQGPRSCQKNLPLERADPEEYSGGRRREKIDSTCSN